MHRFYISYRESQSKIQPFEEKRFVEVFKHRTLLIELYEQCGTDSQTPYTRDEGYIVVKGNGEFVNGKARVKFSAGDFL